MAKKKSPTVRATEIGMACTSREELRSIVDSLTTMLKIRFPKTVPLVDPPGTPRQAPLLPATESDEKSNT